MIYGAHPLTWPAEWNPQVLKIKSKFLKGHIIFVKDYYKCEIREKVDIKKELELPIHI